MIRFSKIAFPLLILFSFLSCGKEEPASDTPSISYLDYTLYKNDLDKDSLLVVRFQYEDGNGDLGYGEADTNYPFNLGGPLFYNLHNVFYGFEGPDKKQYIDGFSGDTIRYSQRLMSLTPEGRYKAISGTMEVRVDFSLLLLNSFNPEKIQLEFWINDRAQNRSETIVTPVIPVTIQ